ncbi:MAG: histidinol-phosphatase [Clostridia bacterium]|nr:histidinol-phosphatase [Clostridia bacterium]
MLHNYHTHTWRCHHASGTEREYIENAIKRGLKTLGFADHTPWRFDGEYYSGCRMRPEMIEDYVRTLTDLKAEYKNDITIRIGFETEYYPAYFDDLLELYRPYPIDYIILGQHWCGNEQGFPNNMGAAESEMDLALYTMQCLTGLHTGKFTYMAHPDAIRFTGSEETYRRHMLPFCREIKKMGIPLEFNLYGFWDRRAYPSERFFKIAAEVGNDVILGIDAHAPDRLLDVQTEARARQFLANLGITPIEDVTLRDPQG